MSELDRERLTQEGFEDRVIPPRTQGSNAMSANGPYQRLTRLTRGEVEIVVEQNTVEMGGGAVTYPAVAVISGPKGRVACDPGDTELLLTLADDLA